MLLVRVRANHFKDVVVIAASQQLAGYQKILVVSQRFGRMFEQAVVILNGQSAAPVGTINFCSSAAQDTYHR